MAGKKISGFSFFGLFKSKNSSRREDYYSREDCVKAYKVWPSDEDRAGHQWVAQPGIDKMASIFISDRTAKWSSPES
ncbi:unnamed protein product [Withania somnifera]